MLINPDFWLILPRIIKPEHDDDLGYWKSDTDYPGLLVPKKIDIGQYLKPMSASLKQNLPVLLKV